MLLGVSHFFYGFFDGVFTWIAWLASVIWGFLVGVVQDLYALAGLLVSWIDLVWIEVSEFFRAPIDYIIDVTSRIWEWIASVVSTITGWISTQFGLVTDGLFAWMDSLFPSLHQYDGTVLQHVIALASTLGYFVDVGFILTTLSATFGIILTLEVSKLVWRSIPGVG